MKRLVPLLLFVLLGASCTGAGTSVLDRLDPPDALIIGDCFDATEEDGVVQGVDIVPCEQPHRFELFGVSSYPAEVGGPYPSLMDLRAEARTACVPALEVYADVWAADRVFDYGFFYPSPDEWANGDRRLVCYLYRYDGASLEASVRAVPLPGRVSVGALEPGTCFDAPPTDIVYTLPTLPCSEPHEYETFAGFELEASGEDPYPGIEVLEQAAAEQCPRAMAEYVTEPIGDDTITYSFYGPSEDSWAAGDRRITCFAHLVAGGRVKGSIAGPLTVVEGT